MAEAYIIDAVRAPVGRRGGGLAHVHPADLGAHSLTALMDRTGVDPSAVEDVIFGCVDTIGPQAGDIARTAWLAAAWGDAAWHRTRIAAAVLDGGARAEALGTATDR